MSMLTHDKADTAFKQMEAAPLLDGCSADDVSARINMMMRDINPFMTEPKKEKGMVKWIVDSMPPSCSSMVDTEMSFLERDGKDDKPEFVAEKMLEVATKMRRQFKKAMAHSVITCNVCTDDEVQSHAMAASKTYGGWAVNAAPGATLGLGGQKPLPAGQMCHEGTCPFKHSGPCWSNANFHGDISQRAWDDKPALARCEARRQAHATRTNVQYRPLKAPKKKGPPTKDRRKALAAAAAVKATVSEASLLADPFVGIGVTDRGFDGALGDFERGYDDYTDSEQEAAMLAEVEEGADDYADLVQESTVAVDVEEDAPLVADAEAAAHPAIQPVDHLHHVFGGAGKGHAQIVMALEGVEIDTRRGGDAGLVQHAAAEIDAVGAVVGNVGPDIEGAVDRRDPAQPDLGQPFQQHPAQGIGAVHADCAAGKAGHGAHHVLELRLAELEPPHARIFVEVGRGDRHLLTGAHHQLLDRLARQTGDLAFQAAHAGFTGVIADQIADRAVGDRELALLQPLRLDLLGDQVAPGDLDLLVLCVAGDADDLHPVEKRLRQVERVRGGHEHDVGQVVIGFQIVVVEGRVLFRIEHFQQGRGRIAAIIGAQLGSITRMDLPL